MHLHHFLKLLNLVVAGFDRAFLVVSEIALQRVFFFDLVELVIHAIVELGIIVYFVLLVDLLNFTIKSETRLRLNHGFYLRRHTVVTFYILQVATRGIEGGQYD